MKLEPNGSENDTGQRLVISENRLDGASASASIRRRLRDISEL
jgi:hypothetical protein